MVVISFRVPSHFSSRILNPKLEISPINLQDFISMKKSQLFWKIEAISCWLKQQCHTKSTQIHHKMLKKV